MLMLGDCYKYCFQMTKHEHCNLKRMFTLNILLKESVKLKIEGKKIVKIVKRDLNYNLLGVQFLGLLVVIVVKFCQFSHHFCQCEMYL